MTLFTSNAGTASVEDAERVNLYEREAKPTGRPVRKKDETSPEFNARLDEWIALQRESQRRALDLPARRP